MRNEIILGQVELLRSAQHLAMEAGDYYSAALLSTKVIELLKLKEINK